MQNTIRLALVGLFAVTALLVSEHSASAQYPVVVSGVSPAVVGYTAERRGLFGRRVVMRPVVAPVATSVAVAAPVVAARPVVSAPVVSTQVVAARPVVVARPVLAAPVVTPVVAARPVVVARPVVPAPIVTYYAPPVVPVVRSYAPVWGF